MKNFQYFALLAMLVASFAAVAQQKPSQAQPQQNAVTEDISGMYTFLREGEFVQVTIEDGNMVSGFVSRYGDSDTDKGSFLDQFFSKGSLKGDHLTFTTKPVHGVWYEFDGTVTRGTGKTPHEEAYRVLRGTLTQSSEDSSKKVMSKSRQVEFKSFPQDLDQDVPEKP